MRHHINPPDISDPKFLRMHEFASTQRGDFETIREYCERREAERDFGRDPVRALWGKYEIRSDEEILRSLGIR